MHLDRHNGVANGSPLRVAVIGVGALGEHHARIWSEIPGVQLVAVVDRDQGRAERVAERFGCEYHLSHRLLRGRVDAASVAVPTKDHASVGCDLLQEGMHVLVEKPIAAGLEEADALIRAQQRSGAVLHVGHSERFNPAFQSIVPWLKVPRFFEAHRLGIFVPRSLDVDVILDLMIHDLDLILWMVQSPLREVRAAGIPVLTPKIDIANARLEFENGCVANVTASRVSREKIRKLRFFQAHEYFSIDFHAQEVEMYQLLGDGPEKQIRPGQVEIARTEPLRQEILTFVSAVKGLPSPSRVPGCSAVEARRVLELALYIVHEMQSRLSSSDFS